MLPDLLEVCAFPAVIKVIIKLIDKSSTVCLQCLECSAHIAHLFCVMAYILYEHEDNNEYVPYNFYCICPTDAQYTEWPKKCIHSLLINIFGISYDSVWMPMVATSNSYIESKIQGHL
jgi:hypothetical protein